MINFQYYPANVKSNKPLGLVSLDYFIKSTQNPKANIIETFNKIAEAERSDDKELKANLKQNNLFYFTPCVIIDGFRRYSNIVKFTGLLVLDFDHIDNAEEFKEYVFKEYRCIIASWLSPSKKGIKALVNIPIVNTTDEFKEYYFGIATEMQQYKGFDESGQNSVLPLFQSYDSKLLYREFASTFNIKGIKVNDFDTTVSTKPINIEPNDDYEKRIYKIIDSGFDNIKDNGHPQLRSLCLSIGGYVANNYIGEHDVCSYIDSKIELHSYLCKGINGYQKTARQMIEVGKSKPLEL